MHSLHPHPGMPHPAIKIVAGMRWEEAETATFKYVVTGDIQAIKFPEPATPERTDGLWQQSCFEAFLRLGDASRYIELNFSPSGAWVAYRFDDYREGMQTVTEIGAPEIRLESGVGEDFSLSAKIDLSSLAPLLGASLALSAVIETTDGTKSYWALAHPPGKPDFHHPDCFALPLAAPSGP